MKPQYLLIVCLTASLFSCRTARVHVEYNNEVDFFKFRTYNWLPRKGAEDKSYYSLKEQKIQSKLEGLLSEKQLHKSDKPDVLIAVNITEKEKVHFNPRFGAGYYPSRYWGYHGFYRYDVDEYTEYTIFVALVDPKTRKALWEGSVKDWNYQGISEESLNEILKAIIDKYPPIAEGAYQEVN